LTANSLMICISRHKLSLCMLHITWYYILHKYLNAQFTYLLILIDWLIQSWFKKLIIKYFHFLKLINRKKKFWLKIYLISCDTLHSYTDVKGSLKLSIYHFCFRAIAKIFNFIDFISTRTFWKIEKLTVILNLNFWKLIFFSRSNLNFFSLSLHKWMILDYIWHKKCCNWL